MGSEWPPPSTERSRRPPRKQRSGWLTALYALFGLGLLLILGGAAAVYLFLGSEQGKQIVVAAKRGVELVATASKAPGAEELRAAGCEVALVDSAGTALEIILPLLPDDNAREDLQEKVEVETGQGVDSLMFVFCALPQLAVTTPDCSDLATVYGTAVESAPDSFAVVVAQQGRDEPVCSGLYGPDGSLHDSFID
jgi:hypothetical protein